MKSTRFIFGRWAALAAAVLLVSSLVFTGCKTDDDDDDSGSKSSGIVKLAADSVLIGTWTDNYLAGNAWNNDLTANPWGSGVTGDFDCKIETDKIYTASYGKQEGTIYQKQIKENCGFLIYQISDTSSYYGKDFKGKWTATYYQIESNDKIFMSDGPWNEGEYKVFDTMEEVIYTADELSPMPFDRVK